MESCALAFGLAALSASPNGLIMACRPKMGIAVTFTTVSVSLGLRHRPSAPSVCHVGGNHVVVCRHLISVFGATICGRRRSRVSGEVSCPVLVAILASHGGG